MRPLLALLALLALPAAAQPAPAVANAPGAGDAFARSGGEVVPDTTAPWRYFPLHVGDAWEYYHYIWGERRRVDVLGEEFHNGRHYFTWRSRTYNANGNQVEGFGPRPVRFDTASAVVRVYFRELDEEQQLHWTWCPLDAAFGSEIVCPFPKLPYEVGGGYDGALAFGGDFPGTGPDTVRTAVKTYYSFDPGNSLDYRYAADIGFVFDEGELGAEGIYYARVNGVEYGRAFYPVAEEAAPPEAPAGLVLRAYPNPFTEYLTVGVAGAVPGRVTVELLDVLGRVARRMEGGMGGAVEQSVRLSGAGLAPGVYMLRVRTEQGGHALQKVLKQ